MSEWFPERQITTQESEHLLMLCGGVPPIPEGIEFFLETTKKIAFPDEAIVFKNLLGHMGASFAEALDMPPRQGSAIFVKGAIFYAGVFQELYPDTAGVPFEDFALSQLGALDVRSASWTVSERIQQEIPSFCNLLDQTTAALRVETQKEHDLALIGAGVVHAVAVDSLHIRQMFDELEDDFKDLDL